VIQALVSAAGNAVSGTPQDGRKRVYRELTAICGFKPLPQRIQQRPGKSLSYFTRSEGDPPRIPVSTFHEREAETNPHAILVRLTVKRCGRKRH